MINIVIMFAMLVLIRNGGGHCNNDVVSPAFVNVCGISDPHADICQLSPTLHSALILHVSCCLRSQHIKIVSKFPINASAEAKDNLRVSHIQDYGNVLTYFPLKYLIITIFSFVNS